DRARARLLRAARGARPRRTPAAARHAQEPRLMRTLAELRSVAQAGKMTDPSWYRVHRALSIHVTLVALKMGLEANRVSMLMMATTLCAAALLASRAGWLNVLGFALGYAGFLVDKVDGEVARLRGRLSLRGILLDRLHHRLVEPTLLLAGGWHEDQLTGAGDIVLIRVPA